MAEDNGKGSELYKCILPRTNMHLFSSDPFPAGGTGTSPAQAGTSHNCPHEHSIRRAGFHVGFDSRKATGPAINPPPPHPQPVPALG